MRLRRSNESYIEDRIVFSATCNFDYDYFVNNLNVHIPNFRNAMSGCILFFYLPNAQKYSVTDVQALVQQWGQLCQCNQLLFA